MNPTNIIRFLLQAVGALVLLVTSAGLVRADYTKCAVWYKGEQMLIVHGQQSRDECFQLARQCTGNPPVVSATYWSTPHFLDGNYRKCNQVLTAEVIIDPDVFVPPGSCRAVNYKSLNYKGGWRRQFCEEKGYDGWAECGSKAQDRGWCYKGDDCILSTRPLRFNQKYFALAPSAGKVCRK